MEGGRAGRLDSDSLRSAVGDLEQAMGAIGLVSIDAALARSAGALAERHALRGYDAVHLATALSVQDPTLVIVACDRDLAVAGLAVGRPVAPDLNPPRDSEGRSGRWCRVSTSTL